MNQFKKVFKKAFLKRGQEQVSRSKNPNAIYLVGKWRTKADIVRLEIIDTDGEIVKVWKRKRRVRVKNATYVVYRITRIHMGKYHILIERYE